MFQLERHQDIRGQIQLATPFYDESRTSGGFMPDHFLRFVGPALAELKMVAGRASRGPGQCHIRGLGNNIVDNSSFWAYS